MNIQAIRKARQDERLMQMVREVCGDEAADRPVTILEVEIGLKALQKYRLKTSKDGVILEKPSKKVEVHHRVIITEHRREDVLFKVEPEDKLPSAYSFLNDYLGIGLEEPMELDELRQKYPEILCTAENSPSSYDWLDTLTSTILLALRHEMNYIDTISH
ncbi:hypothetical protein IJG78_02005 [Candidatus Saccharibacteria bacterium]|nr:hypothetical protein [Candidatus Saccharibacteria bacterium]